MASLNSLLVHQGLQAGEEDKAGALTCEEADAEQHCDGVILNMLVICAHHHCRQNLSSHNH